MSYSYGNTSYYGGLQYKGEYQSNPRYPNVGLPSAGVGGYRSSDRTVSGSKFGTWGNGTSCYLNNTNSTEVTPESISPIVVIGYIGSEKLAGSSDSFVTSKVEAYLEISKVISPSVGLPTGTVTVTLESTKYVKKIMHAMYSKTASSRYESSTEIGSVESKSSSLLKYLKSDSVVLSSTGFSVKFKEYLESDDVRDTVNYAPSNITSSVFLSSVKSVKSVSSINIGEKEAYLSNDEIIRPTAGIFSGTITIQSKSDKIAETVEASPLVDSKSSYLASRILVETVSSLNRKTISKYIDSEKISSVSVSFHSKASSYLESSDSVSSVEFAPVTNKSSLYLNSSLVIPTVDSLTAVNGAYLLSDKAPGVSDGFAVSSSAMLESNLEVNRILFANVSSFTIRNISELVPSSSDSFSSKLTIYLVNNDTVPTPCGLPSSLASCYNTSSESIGKILLSPAAETAIKHLDSDTKNKSISSFITKNVSAYLNNDEIISPTCGLPSITIIGYFETDSTPENIAHANSTSMSTVVLASEKFDPYEDSLGVSFKVYFKSEKVVETFPQL